MKCLKFLTPSSVSTEHYSTASGWLVAVNRLTLLYVTLLITQPITQGNITRLKIEVSLKRTFLYCPVVQL